MQNSPELADINTHALIRTTNNISNTTIPFIFVANPSSIKLKMMTRSPIIENMRNDPIIKQTS